MASKRAFAKELAIESSTEVTVDPQIMRGVPCIAGTRIPVYLILEKLEAGYSLEKILQSYPQLNLEQIKAAIRFAIEMLELGTPGCTFEASDTQIPVLENAAWPGSFDSSSTKG